MIIEQSLMTLDHIFQNKDNWKKDTFYRIKRELLSVKNNRFVRYNQKSATHLVCVYGKSQVGKTTLILNMIGLKDDECKNDVSEVLRGGIARGNSSTSTAIIYSQSDSNQYGVRIETLEGQNLTKDVEFFTKEKMSEKLKTIRESVEKNEFSNKSILHIFIPKDYFPTSDQIQQITILDLPGVESRNINEKTHVESLMARYIPLSSVCIITVPANEIQSLEVLELPNDIDWKSLSHKFYVVITKCYSIGNIKSYFDTPRDQRTTGFLDFLQETYKTNLSNILGPNNKAKVFPLDFGDSLERLCTKELHNEEDRKEVIKTRDAVLSSLRESILNSKGDNLLSCIKELHVIVDKIDKNIKEDFIEKKSKEKEEINRVIIQKSKEIENSRDEYNDIKSRIKRLDEIKIEIEVDLSNAITSFSSSLVNKVKETIEENIVIEDNIRYFYDKDKTIFKTIRIFLAEQLGESIVSKAQKLMEEINLIVDLEASSIALAIDNQFTNQYENTLYPPPSNLLERIKERIKVFFGYEYKIKLATAYDVINRIEHIIEAEIKSSVISKCQDEICKNRKIEEEDLRFCENKINQLNRRIEHKKSEIERLEAEIVEQREKIEILKKQKEQDSQTLKRYLLYAEQAYLKQRNEILKKKINSNNSSAEKVLYVLFLGIIDKDYNTIINSSNE